MGKYELKTEYDKVFISVEYVREKNFLYCNWKGDNLSPEIIKNSIPKGGNLILEKIKEYKVTQIINDNSEVIGVWDAVNDWIETVWIPQAIEAGLKKFAHILSPDLFSQISAELMEINSEKKSDVFQMHLFKNLEEAEKWLAE